MIRPVAALEGAQVGRGRRDIAGGGRKRLFAADATLTNLELVEARPTSSGALIATYRPSR